MDAYVWWFVAGFGLLVAELLTGTFYLLVIALALGVAGLAALLGASLPLQLVAASIIGLGGSMWLRSSRFGRRARGLGADPVQNMDVGQSLKVEHWSASRTARASYRGADWDVELAPGENAVPGEFVIREIAASRLIVAAKPR